jgi:PncC family amidohydrolase
MGGFMETLLPAADRIARLLKDSGRTLAVSESSAGGLIAASLLSVPGASAFFRAGAVVYTRRARVGLMGITDEAMASMRSSSEPYALLLANTARMRFRADWGLAETGASGPDGNRYGDPAGHACIAVAGDGFERVITLRTGSDRRIDNMRAFALAALEQLEAALHAHPLARPA